LELALIQSAKLDRFGRTFVLISGRTFSAAQNLVNILEKYTRVLFVGEPTGARPDHFGDSKKVILEHSGLTLRVSTLHWSSPLANDERPFTTPDIAALWSSTEYFSGVDPAICIVNSYDAEGLDYVLGLAIDRHDETHIERYLIDALRSPDSHANDLSNSLFDIGAERLRDGRPESAELAFQYGQYLYPDEPRFQLALKELSETLE
jgi:hypothetical protein